jgi:hypothetical protein
MFYCKKITELKGYFEKDSHLITIKKSGYVAFITLIKSKHSPHFLAKQFD